MEFKIVDFRCFSTLRVVDFVCVCLCLVVLAIVRYVPRLLRVVVINNASDDYHSSVGKAFGSLDVLSGAAMRY